ncbi:MAG: 2-oxoacid:acceptor oxidoreductase subunit alpha [Chloroflexi bacterium]|nr:2-oxoacid:acceptor oxidoreductase subunit alpha [Chloroflexota bacterium]
MITGVEIMPKNINFMVGGEAGQGVQSVGAILGKAMARGGYHVFADQDYESRIRGGHNFFRVRASEAKVGAIAETVDILLALNEESVDLHREELAAKGVIVFDNTQTKDVNGDTQFLGVPLETLAEKAGNRLTSNTVALGAAMGLLRYDLAIVDRILQEQFGTGEIGQANIRAAAAGYEYAEQNFKGDFERRLSPMGNGKRMLLNGNEAISLGAIAAGCKFVAGYPMTPITSIIEYMASKAEEYGLAVVQPEDEIAVINMVIGASYAGVRAMTATSGGGFCLMVEGLSLAGMTETPAVVVLGQRAGPAIGLPTRTEQGELEFAIHAGHGEFPRAVLAPATIENCFWMTVKAFNLADKYQMPVILLTDHHLAGSYATVERFDFSRLTIDRGVLFTGGSEEEERAYKRHALTESGISPRAFPGMSKALVVTDSDEHDEAGHLIEDARTRTEQMDKRLRRMPELKNQMPGPWRYGPETAEITLIGWGSTYGGICEAVDILHDEGVSVNALHLVEIWPFPSQAMTKALEKTKTTYVVENNATGQLAHLIRAETGEKVNGSILRYDGRPFSAAGIAEKVTRKEVLVW